MFLLQLAIVFRRDLQSKHADSKGHLLSTPRNVLLRIIKDVGKLAELFQEKNEVRDGVPEFADIERATLRFLLSGILINLTHLSQICHVDLSRAVLDKFHHNAAKYPAAQVYGSSKKYNEYPENNQKSSVENVLSNENGRGDLVDNFNGLQGQTFKFKSNLNIDRIREIQSKFVADRNWHQFHTPRNVLFAMTGEVGELSELFQWKGNVQEGVPEFSAKEKKNLEHELSDVLIYLIRLSQICHVDLPLAVLDSFQCSSR